MKSNVNIENMEGKMSLRVAYVAVWVITGLIALCSEEGFLPVEYLSHDPNTDYVVGVVSFLTAIGGTYLALRLLAFQSLCSEIDWCGRCPCLGRI